jgi:hypothetical protein
MAEKIWKERLRNWLTTIIGAILMLTAVGMYVISTIKPEIEFNIMEMVLVAILGWVFLWSKNTLLEGVFLNFFKIKSNGDNSKN